MNKAKLILLTSEFPPQPGGIGNHACNLAKALSLAGIQVQVLTDFRSREMAIEKAFDQELSFRVIRVRRSWQSVMTYLKRIIEAYRLMCSKEPQLVIASGKFSLWLAATGRRFFPKHRYVAIIHGSEINPAGRISKCLTHWSLAQFEQLIAVSRFTRDLVWKVNPRLPVEVINNGFSLPDTAETAAASLQGCPALITVGSVSKRKGQQNVIRALPLLQRAYPDLHYHIVGIPSEQAAFMHLAQELRVEDRLTFHGAVSDAVLPQLLTGADIFMMLSQQLNNGDVEGFGIAVLEANALGLPAIGTLNSGIADAIKDGYSGRLIDSEQPDEVQLAVTSILEDYQTYSDHARAWAQGFTWDKIIAQYLAILDVPTNQGTSLK